MSEFGREEGSTCGRDKCDGLIEFNEVENCSCHISPPCNACTDSYLMCSKCDWSEKDEQKMNGYRFIPDKKTGVFKYLEPIPLDPTKISYRIKSHTNSSQICEGIYPEGTSIEDVRKLVIGTFGGRFESFKDGKFKYIAYTD